MKIFSMAIIGAIVGTILHECYHYLMALIHNANPRIVLAGYGIGIRSTYHSSEIVAFGITIAIYLIFMYWGIKWQMKR